MLIHIPLRQAGHLSNSYEVLRALLTCSRESSPREDIGMWRQGWPQVRPHVHLSGVRWNHLSWGNQVSNDRISMEIPDIKRMNIVYLTTVVFSLKSQSKKEYIYIYCILHLYTCT